MKKVFIGSSYEALDIARILQEILESDFECTVWDQDVFKPSTYTLEALDEVLDTCDYGIFVFSPDDKIIIRDNEFDSIRDNIIFEFGLFVGRLGKENTFILLPDNSNNIRLPSDLAGITSIRYRTDRNDGNLKAAIGPACNKIRREIHSIEGHSIYYARNQYDLSKNKYPSRRSLRYLDTACLFDSRTSFDNCIGIQHIFANAKEIKAIGISLNSITLNWGITNLIRLVQDCQCKISLLFLNPNGVHTKLREQDELLFENTIANVTQTNINLIKKVIVDSGACSKNLKYRLYDDTPFINMYIINNDIMILQHYLSGVRGQETPVYIIRNESNISGLFNLHNALFKNIWEKAVIPCEQHEFASPY